jgi:mono/diheme cytochrome c family protein
MPPSPGARRALLAVALAASPAAGCRGGGDDRLPPPPAIPGSLADGQRLFDANCATCHGAHARGTEQGPPLVHRTYEPGHHGDAAFHLAVRRGVVQHHWRFGDMPAQPQVGEAETARIIAYVRFLQRDAGIE